MSSSANQKNGLLPIPQRVSDFAMQMEMHCTQKNRQRYFGPSYHFNCAFEPAPGSELFLAGLPPTWVEPELYPFLLMAGPFHQLRLMINPNGTNNGFCYVKYCCREQALHALSIFSGCRLEPDQRPLFVTLSPPNKRLVVSGVPTNKTAPEIFERLATLSKGLVSIDLTWISLGYNSPRGFVYATYKSHR